MVAVRTRTRFMDGIAPRLHAHHLDRQHKTDTGITVPYRRSSTIDLTAEINDGTDYGSVRVWRTVVMNPGESKPAREFAPASSAELWTLNGQTHNTRSDRHFGAKRVGLDALIGHLVVEVELDGLSLDAKSLIITTGRHNRQKRALGDRLEEAIDRDLAEDDRLRELNREVREAAFRKASQQRIAGLEQALRAFNLFVKRPKTITKPGRGRDTPPRPEPKPLPPISPLHDHPTDVFRFRTKLRTSIRVQRGHTASVLLEVDVVDGYFDDGPTALSLQFVPDLGEKLRIVALDSLEAGRMRIRFRASKDAPLTTANLVASCLPPNASAPLTASIPVEVIEERPERKSPSGPARGTEIEVEEEVPPPVVVAYKDPQGEGDRVTWADHELDWTMETVGEYKHGVAYINGDYAELVKLRRSLPTEKHADITNVYIAPLAMTLVGLAESEGSAPRDTATGQEVELHQHFRGSVLRSAALSSLFAIRYMNKAGMLDLSDDED